MATYLCAMCGEECELGDEELAEFEAEELWGVDNAASNAEMVRVCDDCFQIIHPSRHPERYKAALEKPAWKRAGLS